MGEENFYIHLIKVLLASKMADYLAKL